MATELFTRVVRKRIVADHEANLCDGKAEDVRLRTPGADWNSIVRLREVGLEDFKQKMQAVFEVLVTRLGETRTSVGLNSGCATSVCATPPPCATTKSCALGATVTKKPAVSLSEVKFHNAENIAASLSTENGVLSEIQPQRTGLCIPVQILEADMKSCHVETDLLTSSPSGLSTIAASEQPEMSCNNSAGVMQDSIENIVLSFPSQPEDQSNDVVDQLQKASISGKKRLRSVSLEKLDVQMMKRPSVQEIPGENKFVSDALNEAVAMQTDSSCDNHTGNLRNNQLFSGDIREPLNKSNEVNKKILQCEHFLSNFYARKHDPTVAVEAVVSSAVAGHARTFLPLSPKSTDKIDIRSDKHKLAEKILLKQEDEDRRKKELEAKKEQERLERIRKREERAKKVMEKNAAIRREEDEKKKAQEQKLQEVQMKRQHLLHQKTQDMHRKVLERQQAAETRKKQEEELKAKKIQELKKTEEVHLELQDEEKKQKILEKIKEKRVAEKIALGKTKQDHENKTKFETVKMLETQAQHELGEAKKEQERLRIEKLFSSDVVKKPLSNHKKVPLELALASNERSEKNVLEEPHHIPLKAPTPVHNKCVTTASYAMTPADPITEYENYSIGDLSSGDSTDEESSPKKPIPEWAHQTKLNKWMENQEKSVATKQVNIESIFPPKQLLHTPELEKIFKTKRKCFFVRSSSAKWNSPLQK